jgi:hypothetical protein
MAKKISTTNGGKAAAQSTSLDLAISTNMKPRV